jgi:hypothetical protein
MTAQVASRKHARATRTQPRARQKALRVVFAPLGSPAGHGRPACKGAGVIKLSVIKLFSLRTFIFLSPVGADGHPERTGLSRSLALRSQV